MRTHSSAPVYVVCSKHRATSPQEDLCSLRLPSRPIYVVMRVLASVGLLALAVVGAVAVIRDRAASEVTTESEGAQRSVSARHAIEVRQPVKLDLNLPAPLSQWVLQDGDGEITHLVYRYRRTDLRPGLYMLTVFPRDMAPAQSGLYFFVEIRAGKITKLS